MLSYYELWAHRPSAVHLLEEAVDYYLAANADPKLPIPRGMKYILMRELGAVPQLSETYADLRKNAPDYGEHMLGAAAHLFDIATNPGSPRLFHAWIFGLFLYTSAPEHLKPKPAHLIRFFRPVLALYKESIRKQDLYFSTLSTVAETAPLAAEPLRTAAFEALRAEWDFFRSQIRTVPTNLARILCREGPDRWPSFLIAVCQDKWPDDLNKPRVSEQEFTAAIQYIVSDVDAGRIASQFWELANLVHENEARAAALLRAVFIPTTAAKPEAAEYQLPPFVLDVPSDPVYLPRLSDYRVYRRGGSISDSHPLTEGHLRLKMYTHKLMQVLLRFALPGGILLVA